MPCAPECPRCRRRTGIRLRSLDDAKKIGRIGTYLKDAKEQYLHSHGFKNLVSTNHNSSNIRRLLEGDIDLWVSSDFNVDYLVRQAGFDPQQIELVYAFRKVSNYIAFSLKTPLETVHKWQQCLNELQNDGTYRQIAGRYGISVGQNVNPPHYRDCTGISNVANNAALQILITARFPKS